MISDSILPHLVRKYEELAETCYRVSVAFHDERGRFRPGHRSRVHPALMKKVDLDRALLRVYERFFGSHWEEETHSTSASNSRPQGRRVENENREPSPACTPKE